MTRRASVISCPNLTMAAAASRVTIHMAASLDGFIARRDGSVDWLETSDTFEGGETLTPESIAEFLASIDCYVMGSRTYETAMNFEARGLGWAYGDKPTFVLTSRELPKRRNSVEFCAGDLARLINETLRPNYRSIWVVGGKAGRRMPSPWPGRRSPLFDRAHRGWRRPLVLRPTRQRRRAAPRGGEDLHERHRGASLRGAAIDCAGGGTSAEPENALARQYRLDREIRVGCSRADRRSDRDPARAGQPENRAQRSGGCRVAAAVSRRVCNGARPWSRADAPCRFSEALRTEIGHGVDSTISRIGPPGPRRRHRGWQSHRSG